MPSYPFGPVLTYIHPTDAAVLSLSTQVTFILSFFLYRNIRIARDRAWAQTVASRGKGPDFWKGYVEEWETPPFVDESAQGVILKAFETSMGRFILKKCEFYARMIVLALISFGQWFSSLLVCTLLLASSSRHTSKH